MDNIGLERFMKMGLRLHMVTEIVYIKLVEVHHKFFIKLDSAQIALSVQKLLLTQHMLQNLDSSETFLQITIANLVEAQQIQILMDTIQLQAIQIQQLIDTTQLQAIQIQQLMAITLNQLLQIMDTTQLQAIQIHLIMAITQLLETQIHQIMDIIQLQEILIHQLMATT